MSWFHEHPWMTFTLAVMLILTVNNIVAAVSGTPKKPSTYGDKQVL